MNQISLTAQAVSHTVFLNGSTLKTNSRFVAEVFGKNHKDVLRAIDNLECSEDFNGRNFAPVEYLDAKGESRRMVEMTFDGFTFVVMGFTGAAAAKFKEAYIAEFNRMRTAIETTNNERMAYLEKYARLPIVPLNDENAAQAVKLLNQRMPIGDVARICRLARATVRAIRNGEVIAAQAELQLEGGAL